MDSTNIHEMMAEKEPDSQAKKIFTRKPYEIGGKPDERR
jgi:hypothetical protein